MYQESQMHNSFRLLCFLSLLVCGCSAEHYARQADLDAQRLIKDREKGTLDYTPQVEEPIPLVSGVPSRAYEKIPTSPIPPKSPRPSKSRRSSSRASLQAPIR